jgi:hypothetical protein
VTALNREALAVTYSELGVSNSKVAKRIDTASGTAKRYLERAAVRYGHSAIQPKRPDDQGVTDLESERRIRIMEYPRGTRKWWTDTARDQSDTALAWFLDGDSQQPSGRDR